MMKKFTLLLFFVGSCFLMKAQVVINEILTNGEIELKNTGGSMVDVTNYWLCDWPAYISLGNLTVECGDLNMAPGSILVVSGFTLDYVDSELGLYNSSAFSSPTAMQDYVEWGTTGHQRSTVAVAGGMWSTGDFVPSFSASASIEYDGGGDASSNWVAQNTNTSCDENEAATGGCDVMGGTIATNDVTTICAGDGDPDPINVSLSGNMGGVSGWVITDQANQILALPTGSPFDLDGAGAGVCFIWHISYEAGLTGLAVNNNVSDLMGCFELSNSITVIRNEPAGGLISTTDATEICALDGVPDPIDVSIVNNVGANSRWVITSQSNDILGIETAPPFDLSGAGAGTCLIWHLSYENGLTGLALGNNFSDVNGCYSLSNSITVVRTVSNGGNVSIAGGGGTNVEVCVGDGEADVVDFATSSTDANYQYVITDENNIILALPSGTSNDFEGVAAGVCRVWGLAYTGNITAAVNDNAATTSLSDECYALSADFITVNRVTTGANCVVSTFDIDGEIYELDLTPNPVNQLLNVKINGKDLNRGLTTISVLSIEGKILMQESFQLSTGEQNLELDVANLAQGLYILQVSNTDKTFNDKFVKN